jgi:response regulator of citrate/malate metabolism
VHSKEEQKIDGKHNHQVARRQLSTLKKGIETLVANKTKDNRNDNKTSAQVGKAVNLSRTKYERLSKIEDKAPELLKNITSGQTSINYAYKKVNRVEGILK